MFSDLVLGSDVVDIRRVEAAYRRFGLRFFQKFLLPGEWKYCAALPELPKPDELPDITKVSKNFEERRFLRRASSRIAAKEATAKALGVGIKGLAQAGTVRWKEMEVQTAQPRLGPQILLNGQAAELAREQGVTRWKLSLTHDGHIAIATVIGLIEKA